MRHLLKANHMRSAMVIGLISAAALVVAANRAHAQQGKWVTQASGRLSKLIDAANKDGYELQNNAFSLGGGWLKKTQNDWIPLYSVQLKTGKKYRFLASGDSNALDVDIRLTDAKGKEVVRDDSTAADAIVNFSPIATGRHTVYIRLYASEKNRDAVVLSVMMSK